MVSFISFTGLKIFYWIPVVILTFIFSSHGSDCSSGHFILHRNGQIGEWTFQISCGRDFLCNGNLRLHFGYLWSFSDVLLPNTLGFEKCQIWFYVGAHFSRFLMNDDDPITNNNENVMYYSTICPRMRLVNEKNNWNLTNDFPISCWNDCCSRDSI